MNIRSLSDRGGNTRSIGDVLAKKPGYGDSPRTGQPVWRNSYYEGTIEDRLWKPFEGGNKRNAMRKIASILKAARELERRTRRERQQQQPGVRNGQLGQIALDVLEILYRKYLDFKTGTLEPAVATIAEAIGHSYSSVHNALKRLRTAGFLHWVRRSRPLDNDGMEGPQVEQITNAYVLMVPPAVQKLVNWLMGKAPVPDDARYHAETRRAEWDAMLNSMSATDMLAATWTGDSLLGETLKNLARSLDERESFKARETGNI